MKRSQSRTSASKSSSATRPTKSVQTLKPHSPKRAAPALKKKPVRKPTAGLSQAPQTKQAQLILQLSSARGASMAQMTALTGWLPHTVRGMLSGTLRKRLGLNVQQRTEEGVRVYRILGAGEGAAR